MGMTIKEAASELTLKPHTLRYYENEGLIPNIDRDDNGNRVFSDQNVEWLKFVCCLRNTGMPIKDMKHFVDLQMAGDHTIPNRLEILYEHKADMEEKIAQLEEYMVNIQNKIQYYEGIID